ncbi:MAG: hypothetical protein IPN53_03335 [Comamonadaceae bacterium]|nr:hypothetical protein [Comamonadaceae bacterium]
MVLHDCVHTPSKLLQSRRVENAQRSIALQQLEENPVDHAEIMAQSVCWTVDSAKKEAVQVTLPHATALAPTLKK